MSVLTKWGSAPLRLRRIHPEVFGQIRNALALTVLMASPAAAQEGALVCRFDTECIETEACAESAFTVEVSGDVATLMTEFGDLNVDHYDVIDEATNVFLASGSGAMYLMSIYENNVARLSVHLTADPMVMTYHGTCGEEQ